MRTAYKLKNTHLPKKLCHAFEKITHVNYKCLQLPFTEWVELLYRAFIEFPRVNAPNARGVSLVAWLLKVGNPPPSAWCRLLVMLLSVLDACAECPGAAGEAVPRRMDGQGCPLLRRKGCPRDGEEQIWLTKKWSENINKLLGLKWIYVIYHPILAKKVIFSLLSRYSRLSVGTRNQGFASLPCTATELQQHLLFPSCDFPWQVLDITQRLIFCFLIYKKLLVWEIWKHKLCIFFFWGLFITILQTPSRGYHLVL